MTEERVRISVVNDWRGPLKDRKGTLVFGWGELPAIFLRGVGGILPTGTILCTVCPHWWPEMERVAVRILHPDLPLVTPGSIIPIYRIEGGKYVRDLEARYPPEAGWDDRHKARD